jgi:hypothetical protein
VKLEDIQGHKGGAEQRYSRSCRGLGSARYVVFLVFCVTEAGVAGATHVTFQQQDLFYGNSQFAARSLDRPSQAMDDVRFNTLHCVFGLTAN